MTSDMSRTCVHGLCHDSRNSTEADSRCYWRNRGSVTFIWAISSAVNPTPLAATRMGTSITQSAQNCLSFVSGIERLKSAYAGSYRVALMCSELDAERCHRAKLIGVALARQEVPLLHIDRDGLLRSQSEVIERIQGRQESLFGESFFSRARHDPSGQK